ncbi:MAG TPA: cytochrome P450 [Gemmatales bacterium]|nr:cytochrome P450 [Gemmatales bacterium]HMP59086.1 cytochrome P450 [Gemmatales bacterium]
MTAAVAPIPAPAMPGGWLLGNLTQFAADPLAFLTRCQRERGEIVRIRLGWQRIIVVSQPDHIASILVNRDGHYRKRRIEFKALGTVIGAGLLTTDGEVWKQQRKLMQPLFAQQQLARYGPDMTTLTARQIERWRPAARSQEPLDITLGITDLTLAIVAKTLLGTEFSATSTELKQAIVTAIQYADQFDQLITLPPWIPTPKNRRFLKARALLDSLVFQMIEQRRQRLDEGHDLLAVLVRATDAETGQGMTNQTLRDQVMTFFLAGHETTAQALSWTLYLLAQHPEVQERVRAEAERVLGDRPPTCADLHDLEYTKQVVLEGMRLYPPVWALAREVVHDHELGGCRVPAGCEVMFSQWVMHRHPDYWEEPERFDPERFSSARSVGRSLGVYFPFGGGPRVCIGQTFSMVELQLILPMILRAFRLELVADHPVTPATTITLRPTRGIHVRLFER